MSILLHTVHVITALFLVLVVLLQSGRGGGMGAAFGGASGHIFGGRGAAPFLAKVTAVTAGIFFITSMSLSVMSSRHRSVLFGSKPPAAAIDQAPVSNDIDEPDATTAPAAAESNDAAAEAGAVAPGAAEPANAPAKADAAANKAAAEPAPSQAAGAPPVAKPND